VTRKVSLSLAEAVEQLLKKAFSAGIGEHRQIGELSDVSAVNGGAKLDQRGGVKAAHLG